MLFTIMAALAQLVSGNSSTASSFFVSQAKATPVARTIIAKVPFQTYATDKIYLTGSTDALCNWTPACVQMSPLGFNVFQATVTIPDGTDSIQFKVTRGDWTSEATNQYGVLFGNSVIQQTDPVAPVVLQILGWKDRAQTGASPLLQIIPNFHSPELNNDRTMRVLVPASYATSPNKSYPVIYMPDAQNIFDSATANYGVEWNVDETYASMVAAGTIKEAIIVGLDANADRLNEYDWTVRGQQYANFLINTVKPYVDSHYRTLTDRANTYSSGSSMGAHISFALIWHHPEVFSKAAGLSLPAGINNNSLYQIITAATKPTLKVEAYMDHGDYNGDAGFAAQDDAFMPYLQNTVGFPMTRMIYENYHYADHFEADWSRRFSVALQFLLGVNPSSKK